MERRHLGKDGPEVSSVGLGCWAIGGDSWGPVDDRESENAIRRAVDLGIDFIDTADVYGLGRGEEVVGRAIRGLRDRVFLATKGGLEWDASGKVREKGTRAHLRAALERSLKRLGVEQVDLYQVHWPDPETPVEESVEAVAELRREGKTRFIGVSNFSAGQMSRALAASSVHSLQPPYSLLNRKIESEILPLCAREGVGVCVYGPLARGLLTGKYRQAPEFPKGDIRASDPRFRAEGFRAAVRLVEALREAASALGRTPAQVAIRWVLENPAVSVAIAGAKTAAQVEENAGAAGWTMPPEIHERLATAPRSASP